MIFFVKKGDLNITKIVFFFFAIKKFEIEISSEFLNWEKKKTCFVDRNDWVNSSHMYGGILALVLGR